MSDHPITNNFAFKDLIYKLSLLQIILLFLVIFSSLSLIFFFLYNFLLENENISKFMVLKYSIFQSFGFDTDGIKTKNEIFEYLNFIQLFVSLVISLIFTSSIVLKYFIKPIFFHFKEKINIDNNILIISLYNKTDFQLTNCHFDIYARLPYIDYIDKEGFNSLNNIKLHPVRDIFPFMDKHLVTRLRMDLNDPKNKTDFVKNGLNEGILQLLDPKKSSVNGKIQYLRISVLVSAMSDKIDNSIYEIKNYLIDVNNIDSIRNNVTYKAPNSIDIDMIDFSKSKGWENFED